MADPRFYARDLRGPVVRLESQEARHALQSRRLRAGDPVILFDGLGGQAEGRIEEAAEAGVEVRIDRIGKYPRPEPELTLALAIPKGPRQGVLIEKCTELGAAALWPIQTARSVCSASDHKLEKWHRATIEAAKQSGQSWLPFLAPLKPLGEVLRDISAFDLLMVAAPGSRTMTEWLPHLAGSRRVLAFVGPEGGWTDSEVADLDAAGCRPISLGANTLRIETAAIAIAAMVHALARPNPAAP